MQAVEELGVVPVGPEYTQLQQDLLDAGVELVDLPTMEVAVASRARGYKDPSRKRQSIYLDVPMLLAAYFDSDYNAEAVLTWTRAALDETVHDIDSSRRRGNFINHAHYFRVARSRFYGYIQDYLNPDPVDEEVADSRLRGVARPIQEES